MPGRTSKQSMLHPYQRISNWLKPEYQFWETPLYTEKAKEHYRKLIEEWSNKPYNLR